MSNALQPGIDEARLDGITRTPLPGSRRIYATGTQRSTRSFGFRCARSIKPGTVRNLGVWLTRAVALDHVAARTGPQAGGDLVGLGGQRWGCYDEQQRAKR